MRRGKYNVAPKAKRTYKGITYDSKLEKTYRQRLDFLMKATGKDKVLLVEEQVPYPIYINDVKVFTYLLDFRVTYADGRTELVDVKGVRTDIYRIKKKCVEAYYKIKIKEVYAKDF